MSRVTYANTQATVEQERLRMLHQVRLITAEEEGTGVDALPSRIYGFTYSPALPNSPLFAARRFRTFETHKLADGQVVVVGFASEAHAQAVEGGADGEIVVQPEPEEGADRLVIVPYSRIRQHRQYAMHTEHGIKLRIAAR
jgi:hypothetical protein